VKTDGSVIKKTLAESDGYTFPKEGAKVGAKVTGRLQNGVVFEQTENDALLQWTVDEGGPIPCTHPTQQGCA
jgi:FKBP-type peptidyl-prolyl cis-trans isomerase